MEALSKEESTKISIHALLAESDPLLATLAAGLRISIHALLAESDAPQGSSRSRGVISIHALLAESDRWKTMQITANA